MILSGLGKNDVNIIKKDDISTGFCPVCRYTLKHRTFTGDETDSIIREVVVKPKSIGAILYDPAKDSVVMIEQFRIGAYLNDNNPWLLEIVAGFVEPDETIKQTVLREIEEEANYKPIKLISLSNILLSPGYSTEKLHLYCGIVDADHTDESLGVPHEHEYIRTHIILFDKIYSMLEKGDINNAPAIIAIQWLKLNRYNLSDYEYI